MRAVARILIVGGGCPGRRLARQLVEEGHAVRMTTRGEDARAAIEAAGAECWVATPARLGTLRAALEGVTLACWLLARARDGEEGVGALHGRLLEGFMRQLIDTTVRAFIYDASTVSRSASGSAVAAGVLAQGARIARTAAERNAIPISVVDGELADDAAWLVRMRGAARSLLGCNGSAAGAPSLS